MMNFEFNTMLCIKIDEFCLKLKGPCSRTHVALTTEWVSFLDPLRPIESVHSCSSLSSNCVKTTSPGSTWMSY